MPREPRRFLHVVDDAARQAADLLASAFSEYVHGDGALRQRFKVGGIFDRNASRANIEYLSYPFEAGAKRKEDIAGKAEPFMKAPFPSSFIHLIFSMPLKRPNKAPVSSDSRDLRILLLHLSRSCKRAKSEMGGKKRLPGLPISPHISPNIPRLRRERPGRPCCQGFGGERVFQRNVGSPPVGDDRPRIADRRAAVG